MMTAVQSMVGRIFEGHSSFARYVARQVPDSYVVSWSDMDCVDLRTGKAITFSSAVMSGGAPGGYIWTTP
jgi:hypothetical protein